MLAGELPLRRFLEPIADDLAATRTREIVINRPGEVGIETADGWTWRDVPDFTYERLDQIGILAGYMTGRDLDPEHPFVGSTLPDGQRIQICRPPVTNPGTIAMAIRRPATTARKVDDPDFDNLFTETNAPVSRSNAYDRQLRELLAAKDYRAFFRLARKARKCIDVCGPTGSGKTDLSKRLMQETAPELRIVTIESDPEYGAVGPRNMLNLYFNEQHPEMQPEAAVKAALRLRPDEIWFQETRGAEAWAVLRARAAGHRGGGTTWHAEQGKEIDALALMARQHPAAAQMPDDKLKAICLQYIDIIVWCDRIPDEGFKAPRVWMKGMDHV